MKSSNRNFRRSREKPADEKKKGFFARLWEKVKAFFGKKPGSRAGSGDTAGSRAGGGEHHRQQSREAETPPAAMADRMEGLDIEGEDERA